MRGFKIVDDKHRKNKDVDIKIPTRGSRSSAGYDFYSPVTIRVMPGCESEVIFTDIKAYMEDDEVLQVYPRSGMAFKTGLRLMNTVGIIDADYFENPDNDGNIGIKFFNATYEVVVISAGDRIAQGIFTKYLIVDEEEDLKTRTGGFGSTGK